MAPGRNFNCVSHMLRLFTNPKTLKSYIDLGKNERTLELAFVALSQGKNVNHFLIQPFTLDRFTKSTSLPKRVKEESRFQLIVENKLNKYKDLIATNY